MMRIALMLAAVLFAGCHDGTTAKARYLLADGPTTTAASSNYLSDFCREAEVKWPKNRPADDRLPRA